MPAKKKLPRLGKAYLRPAIGIGIFVLTALLGAVTGVLLAYSPDLPQISELDSYSPGTITHLYARNGELIGEFATERRMMISYDDIPAVLQNAIISAEDGDFFTHTGFNIPSFVRTLVSNVRKGDLTAAGGSTLTMQLARQITLSTGRLGTEKRWARKLREIYYAFHIEKRYTKREILTFYANQMYLGTERHSAHGVEAASRLYFEKAAKDLTLTEAATIAGIFQAPARQSPLVNMEFARSRRNYTLGRMVDEGHITQAEAVAAKTEPIALAPRKARSNTIAPYFIEEIRQHLEAEYGVSQLYEKGLTVHTTLDARLQEAADRAIQAGLRAYDKRHGFRPPARNILLETAEGEAENVDPAKVLSSFEHSRWIFEMREGDIVPAIVTDVEAETMHVRFGPYATPVVHKGLRVLESGETEGFRGIGRTPANELVKPGDLIEVKISTLETHNSDGQLLDEPIIEAELEQEPVAEAALIAIENRTGRVLAMVGGYDFARSKFNRSTQAQRQLGSLFKGALYAAAIDQGYTATATIPDEKTCYEPGPEQDPYCPENYDHTYEKTVTLRHALERSKNAPAVWMMNEIGPQTVVDFSARLGFTSEILPFLSVALGSAESTLEEITSAYSAFPNRGTRMVPYQIERIVDQAGDVLEEFRPQPRDAVRPDTAYIMVSLMRGVVQRGTGRGLLQLDWPVGGKTGTVDDYTDAWFVGFDPAISVGVWVGFDEKKTLGDGEEGARVALPIWREFMHSYIEGRNAPEGFSPPANIVFASVDQKTGELAEPWATGVIQEAFIAGTEPGATFDR